MPEENERNTGSLGSEGEKPERPAPVVVNESEERLGTDGGTTGTESSSDSGKTKKD